MGLSLITAPTQEPVSLTEMMWHLRVDTSDEDGVIRSIIKASREYCEIFTGRQFVSATYDQTFDGWSTEMILDKPPLSSVTTVKYYDEDGVEQTLSSAIYDVVTNVEPGKIRLAYDQSWATHRSQDEAITVRFIAGYGDPDDVPESIRHAIKLLGAHLYEHREAVSIIRRGEVVAEMPMACKSLLWSHKMLEAV